MDIRDWRLKHEITMAEAAKRLGLDSARTYQRYETGENRPDAPMLVMIHKMTDGSVTVEDMHRLRFGWLRQNKPDAVPVLTAEIFDAMFCPEEAAE